MKEFDDGCYQAALHAPTDKPVKPELLVSALLHLMSNYSISLKEDGSCARLAAVIERHLQALADAADLAPAHADKLINRILMLEGLPNLQALHKLMIGENVPEILQCDLQLERASQASVKRAIAACENASDYVSRDILEDILSDTEEHIDHIETQLELVNKVGLQNYLQSQMHD